MIVCKSVYGELLSIVSLSCRNVDIRKTWEENASTIDEERVSMAKVLVASEDGSARQTMLDCLQGRGGVQFVVDARAFAGLLRDAKGSKGRYEFLFVDLGFLQALAEPTGLPDPAGELKFIRNRFPGTEIIVMCIPQRIREAVRAVKAGADDYITYPIGAEEVRLIIESIRRDRCRQLELEHLRENALYEQAAAITQTNSPLMREVFRQVGSVAPTRTTVLLCGETGTGKGVLAKLVHSQSNRSKGPFIMVHCGSIAEPLVESELFGHEKGAFTGADRRKLGKFEIAKGGTIFLDEVGTITQAVQIKLLQVIQERSFYRVGGETTIEADVRIVAATNDDLGELIQAGKFRQDLYYRLNVFPIKLPPLRERPEDIPVLAEAFLKRLNDIHAKAIQGIDSRAIDAFRQYTWPGNVRELENVMERAYILENSKTLTPECFPTELLAFPALVSPERENGLPSLSEARSRSLEMVERQYLREVLTLYQGRIHKSAQTAGISPRQLHNLMKRHGLRKEDFK